MFTYIPTCINTTDFMKFRRKVLTRVTIKWTRAVSLFAAHRSLYMCTLC